MPIGHLTYRRAMQEDSLACARRGSTTSASRRATSRSRRASTRASSAMERIPTPTFETPVQWLRVGDMQLHLFLDDGAGAARGTTSGSRSTTSTRPTTRSKAHVVRHVGLAARRAPVAAGAALLPRPGRQPDRAELARRRHARPLALPGARAARRARPADGRSRRTPSSTSNAERMTDSDPAAAARRRAGGGALTPRSCARSGSRAGLTLARGRRRSRCSGCSSSRRRPASARRRSARRCTTRRTS